VTLRGAGRRCEFREVRPVRRWFFHFAKLYLKPPIRYFCKFRPENENIIPRSGAAILVAYHVTLFDPIWICDVLKRPVYFVTTEELFRGRLLRFLLRWFGAFPKRKAVRDSE
jgi:1-acyl-sn-glycerol-3-phosphate acyltransferase